MFIAPLNLEEIRPAFPVLGRVQLRLIRLRPWRPATPQAPASDANRRAVSPELDRFRPPVPPVRRRGPRALRCTSPSLSGNHLLRTRASHPRLALPDGFLQGIAAAHPGYVRVFAARRVFLRCHCFILLSLPLLSWLTPHYSYADRCRCRTVRPATLWLLR